jgi:regulator of sigma D
MAQASALPNVLQPLVNQMQNSGLYRLYIPDPSIAARVASGQSCLSSYNAGFTTSILKKGSGYDGSGYILKAGSTTATVLAGVFGALSLVTFQYYLHTINSQLSRIQQQLQDIMTQLEIETLARFNTCITKLLELAEDFYALTCSADSDHPAGHLEKQVFLNQLNNVDQICKQLAEETNLALKLKRTQLDTKVSKKEKIETKDFEECGSIIEQRFNTCKLKLFLLNLIVKRDRFWCPNTLKRNEQRLETAYKDIDDIIEVAKHFEQTAINEDKSRGLWRKFWDRISMIGDKEGHTNPYEPIKKRFEALGEQLSSTAPSYYIYFNREQNSMKILPEVGNSD